MDPDETEVTPTRSKPSLTFSWATLGFLVGALFVLALPPRRSPPSSPVPAPVERPQAAPERPAGPPRLSTIEAVFAQWAQYAVWHNDLTEVALFDPELHRFSDCYEVLRSGGVYFFRSIPQLTNPVLSHGIPSTAPLLFTETPEQRSQWMQDRAEEAWRPVSTTPRSDRP